MITETGQAPSEEMPEHVVAGYRLDASPGRREGGSLLFSATASRSAARWARRSALSLSRSSRAAFFSAALRSSRRLARARFSRRASSSAWVGPGSPCIAGSALAVLRASGLASTVAGEPPGSSLLAARATPKAEANARTPTTVIVTGPGARGGPGCRRDHLMCIGWALRRRARGSGRCGPAPYPRESARRRTCRSRRGRGRRPPRAPRPSEHA